MSGLGLARSVRRADSQWKDPVGAYEQDRCHGRRRALGHPPAGTQDRPRLAPTDLCRQHVGPGGTLGIQMYPSDWTEFKVSEELPTGFYMPGVDRGGNVISF